MVLTQAMETLTEEIRSATMAREASLSHLRQELINQMQGIHNDNQRNATELRVTLAGSREYFASEEKNRQNTARQEPERRRVVRSELRVNTHSLLSRDRLERQETSKALQNHIAVAINDLRVSTKSLLDEIAADLRGAHEVWISVKKKQ